MSKEIKLSESILQKRIKRFKSIKRGYYSLIAITVLYILSLCSPLLINNKAPKIKKNKNIISIKKINILSSEQVRNYLNKFKQLTIFFLASYNISTTEKETSNILKKNILINVNGLINFLEYISNHNKKMKFVIKLFQYITLNILMDHF